MRLTVVGSADAFNSAGRRHSCYLLDGAASQPIMIDFGATALSGLKQIGRSPLELGGIAVTHLHGDHVGGFPFLLIDGMYNLVRSEPLEVVGPIGTEAKIDELLKGFYGDLADRDRPFEMRIIEIAPGEQAPLLGATVQGFEAEHMDPPEQPLCLRITTPDGDIISFSGDTEMRAGLRSAAKGANLLVAECTAMRPPAGRHCTWQEWQTELPTIGADHVLLTHLNDEMRAAAPNLRGPDGVKLSFAEDGLIIDV